MEETNFVINNDKKADWAITQIKEAETERYRLVALAEEQIEDLKINIENIKSKCDNDTAYLRSLLDQYFRTVPHKETKTQETYKLLSGTLVMKKPSFKINHDDNILLGSLKDGFHDEFIKVKESIDWDEYKKHVEISGNDVIDLDTGEILEGCTVEKVPASFNIKY